MSLLIPPFPMFNWLSRRNQSAKPKSRGAREVVSEIADVDSLDALARIAGALETLRESSLSLEGRFDEIHRLDIAGQPKLMDLTQEYLMTLRHQKAHESRLWGVANGYLRELYQTYLFCLRRYLADPQGSLRFKPKVPIKIGRAHV